MYKISFKKAMKRPIATSVSFLFSCEVNAIVYWPPRDLDSRSCSAQYLFFVIYILMHVDSGVASYGALGHVPPRLPTISFLVHFGVNHRTSSVVCELSWCRCQQLTARSISTASVTKLLVIEQLLQLALKFAVSDP